MKRRGSAVVTSGPGGPWMDPGAKEKGSDPVRQYPDRQEIMADTCRPARAAARRDMAEAELMAFMGDRCQAIAASCRTSGPLAHQCPFRRIESRQRGLAPAPRLPKGRAGRSPIPASICAIHMLSCEASSLKALVLPVVSYTPLHGVGKKAIRLRRPAEQRAQKRRRFAHLRRARQAFPPDAFVRQFTQPVRRAAAVPGAVHFGSPAVWNGAACARARADRGIGGRSSAGFGRPAGRRAEDVARIMCSSHPASPAIQVPR
jgi:hypothetical protein